ncbi:MAG: Alpha/Beta hydrolase protein [Benniella sp.]|nr:MAG: Alpha/Beta hydrolase protein [Benniella sp.]
MAQGKNRLFWLTSLAIASIPLAVTFYAIYSDKRWLTILSFTLFLICLLLSTCTFLSWKTFKFSAPIILQLLRATSVGLSPFVNLIRNIPVLGKVTNWMIPGKAGSDLSSMSSEDWALALKVANIEKSSLPSVDRPRYSQPIATTLAMLAKLVYEDVPIIRHELALSGYDMHSFRAIAYRNTYGFIVQKGRNIVLVFRGTDPLNLQNAWTDIQSHLVQIETLQDPPTPLGKCHHGMYTALGKTDNFLLPSNTLNLELSNHSIYHTIASSLNAAWFLVKFLVSGLFTHVSDPVDYRFAGENRDLGAFAQASRWVDGLRLEHAEKEYRKMQKMDPLHPRKKKKLRFYVCGHSLGGGLATIFLAKMVQCNSPLLDIFAGLYTYGQPRIGDKDFSTLVFMDTSRKLTLYPPDPVTLMPVPVRGISFIHLSGMLNLKVIKRMRKESWLRVMERIFLPFFLNDHFPGDYVKALAEGTIEVVVQDPAQYGGIDETDTGRAAQTGYFSLLSRRRRPVPSQSTTPSRRWSYAGQGKRGLDLPSDDIDSGYMSPKVRQGIVKYTYHQDDEDDYDDDDDDDEDYDGDAIDSPRQPRD